ncbi:MAG: hypothetical protein ACQXXL_03560 [Candidatus Methanosuratincola sp.]|jgi:galactose-1-phosphate uridylyltransferase|nr:hypothetical protein [Candidatus Methanosuratincola sp.]
MPDTGVTASCEIEVRTDPLTGAVARINRARQGRPRQQEATPVPEAMKGCPFCRENIESSTPTFTPDFCQSGRIRAGRAVVFPNMYPLSPLHGVVVFTPEHKLEINGYGPEELADGIMASAAFARAASERGYPFHFLGWNHLSQAGASILHPHFQVIAGKSPVSSLRECIASCRSYREREGRCFWDDLLESEVGSQRYVGKTRGFSWIAPWAPTGTCEVIGVLEGEEPSLLELETECVLGLADGISRILRGYWELGIRSVTMGIFSLPPGHGEGTFRLHARIMGRSRRMGCDRAFLELYGWEVGLTEFPEEYAASLRGFF